MATDTSTSTTVEPGDNHQHALVRWGQHIGVFALLGSFQVVYSTFIVIANEVFAEATADVPAWLDIVIQTGFGIPVVVVLALAFNYVIGVVGTGDAFDWTSLTLIAGAVSAVGLPLWFAIVPGIAGAI